MMTAWPDTSGHDREESPNAEGEGSQTPAEGSDGSSPVGGLNDTIHFTTTCQKMAMILCSDTGANGAPP